MAATLVILTLVILTLVIITLVILILDRQRMVPGWWFTRTPSEATCRRSYCLLPFTISYHDSFSMIS